MRKIILLVCFLLTPGFFFIACKKDDKSTSPPNKAPIANAGLDKTITRLSCGSVLSIDLDGSGSSDPDNNMLSYVWRNINLPSQAIIKDSTKASTSVFNISIGQYAFELKVTDAGGLSSKDTILVNVIESEYNLDITINGTYNFEDNHPNCYYLYYNYDPYPFNDITTIPGEGNFSPFGEFNFLGSEYADTADLSDVHDSYFSLYTGNGNSVAAYGTSTINFKKVIIQGGGSFTGNFTVTGGSAQRCNSNIFTNLPPLAISGTLNTTTKTVTLNIKGKIFF